ncbi:unnamed protein product, partial [Mesorhabditis spiculigera]
MLCNFSIVATFLAATAANYILVLNNCRYHPFYKQSLKLELDTARTYSCFSIIRGDVVRIRGKDIMSQRHTQRETF